MSIATVPRGSDRSDWPRPVLSVSASVLTFLGAQRAGLSRRGLQVALGVLWVLDGLLQLQPVMRSPRFATEILIPTSVAQPGWVAGPVHQVAHLVGAHALPVDLLFAGVQLAIGVGLLVRRSARAALAASVGWAVGIWFFGEGLGGIAGGTASFLTGAPGAASLYALLAVAAWPATTRRLGAPVGGAHGHPTADEVPGWFPCAWAILWVALGLVTLLPANRSVSAVTSQIHDVAAGSPGWIARLDHLTTLLVGRAGVATVVLLVALPIGVGVMGLVPGRWRQVAGWSGVALALAVWMVGQGLGELTSGSSTDPNAGPLLVLAGLALVRSGRGRAATPWASPVWPRPTSPRAG